ncbi:ferritin-like domain-containing protein [Halostella pelagica]|uniref:ferritin-like domain-containing protein n=1 Tax=Halostella pelagica TaxID=2583824 RepID=UPI001F2C1F71|nr:ferritin-like domain-containing protein [Halostella pelagica]
MDEVTDVDVLNYALTLEHLEDVFYDEGVSSFDEETVIQSDAAQRFGDFVSNGIYDNIARIGRHEATHTEALTATIEDLGGEPVPECTYEFGYSTFNEFIAIARTLENTGVAAYNGAIALIDDPDLVTTGATIATVEARHASYLNLLNEAIPFPEAFDDAKPMQEILDAAGGFIVECPDGMGMADGGNGRGGTDNGGDGSGYGRYR